MIEYKGRSISGGWAKGEAIVSREPISFYGGIDLDAGVIIEKGHVLEGRSIVGKILVFPRGKGSTVGSYIIYRLAKNGLAPKAMVNIEAEPIVAVGAIISGIPMIDEVDREIFDRVHDGDIIEVDGDNAILKIY